MYVKRTQTSQELPFFDYSLTILIELENKLIHLYRSLFLNYNELISSARKIYLRHFEGMSVNVV